MADGEGEETPTDRLALYLVGVDERLHHVEHTLVLGVAARQEDASERDLLSCLPRLREQPQHRMRALQRGCFWRQRQNHTAGRGQRLIEKRAALGWKINDRNVN